MGTSANHAAVAAPGLKFILMIIAVTAGLVLALAQGARASGAGAEALAPAGAAVAAVAEAAPENGTGGQDEFVEEDPFAEMEEEVRPIADPIEPFNRAMFVFNDKMYFWVLKPAARGYNAVVPEKGRVAVKRFFTNLTTPIRLVNSVLQLKLDRAGTELARFCINTTVGVLGFMDPARDTWEIYLHDEDTGQTLGHWGLGPGFFITWPIFGPSSVRDTFGLIGDFFLDPTSYLFAEHPKTGLEVSAYDKVNTTSLNLGLYEDLKAKALDPYSFIRDAYHQHREHLVKE